MTAPMAWCASLSLSVPVCLLLLSLPVFRTRTQLSHLNELLPKDTPFRTLISVHSIDDQRRIVGDGQLKTGAYHAFVLTIEGTPDSS